MKNFVQPGHIITATAPTGGVTSGDPVLIGNLFGVASTTQAEGEDVELSTVGVFDLPKAAVVVTAGAVAYYDESEGVVTTTDDTGSNLRVGIFVTAAADSASIGRVRLDGSAS
jgi:predicted RecA/RadA family phage recombinase